MEKGIKILEKMMIAVVGAIGLFMALYLSYYSMRYSYSMKLEYTQEVFEYADSIGLHLAAIVLFVAILFMVFAGVKKFKGHTVSRKLNVSMLVVMGIMFGLCMAWIFGIKNVPLNDQNWLLETVAELDKGNYDVFLPYGFLGAVQYQIGLATIFRFIFRLFHSFNYQIIQVINALCVPILVYFGGKYIRKVTDDKYTEVIYSLLMLLCLPIYVYSAFVYGEIISITVGMAMIWYVLSYIENEKAVAAIPVAICAILGTMTRGNYWVLIIACSIVLAWYGISRKKWKYGIIIMCMVLAPILQNKIMVESYERIIGFELEAGMSKELWFAMGMHENGDVANGWYNGYSYRIYNELGQDSEAATLQAKAYISDRLKMFKNGASDWKAFYQEKILSQWNEPTCECFCATDRFEGGSTPLIDNIYTGEIHKWIESFMNQHQLIIYLGFVLYILACLIRKAPFVNYLLVIYIIGGILFSALWEASSRYVFPYFVFMIPCAAYGWTSICTMFLEKKDRIIRKSKRAN